MEWQKIICRDHTDAEFKELCFKVYEHQIKYCKVYADYVNALGRETPSELSEIPFMPISLFKTNTVLSDEYNKTAHLFKSSGTTGSRSEHYVVDIELYHASIQWSYKKFIGNVEEQVVLALLPNYMEQGNSSLVHMVDFLIKRSGNEWSKFVLNDREHIKIALKEAKKTGKQVVFFGVAYSLLDLCGSDIGLENCIVIETGGMKGRRKEVTKSELHRTLIDELGINTLYSEYGMTELLSQAYCKQDLVFGSPPWMRVTIRDVYDPLTTLESGKRGGVNVIDLANVHSCSFIATDDIGVCTDRGFEIRGRMDRSDIRGCNLLVD